MDPSQGKYFDELVTYIEANKIVPLNLTINALRYAEHHCDLAEVVQFVEDYLYRLIFNVTQTSHSKMGVIEREIMEETLGCACNLCLKFLPKYPNLICCVARVFDQKIPFYAGAKIGYTYSHGSAVVRYILAKKFSTAKGFNLVVQAMEQDIECWLGAETYLQILLIVGHVELSSVIHNDVKQDLAHSLKSKLLALHDDHLKRENTDNLQSLVSVLGRMMTDQNAYQQFWFQFIVKLIMSSSLVMKLFGWEQLGEIIEDAKLTKPLPRKYEIRGAGSAFVNGIYVSQQSFQDLVVPQYTKNPESIGVPLLTLFRCTMKNSVNKWWFLSHADSLLPGTDKDVDYYLHCSSSSEERQPPSTGWQFFQKGMALKGVGPAPTLTPIGEIMEEGKTRESYFDMKLLNMCLEQRLDVVPFNLSTIHREIVARSAKLMIFLSEYNAVSETLLSNMWSAAMETSDTDIYEEMFSLLVSLSPHLSEQNFATIMYQAHSSLSKRENLPKIACFVEKFSADGCKHIGVLPGSSLSSLITLVWAVYTSLGSDAARSTAIAQDLLSYCFKQPNGDSFVLEKIREATDQLISFGESTQPNEEHVNQVLQTLSFLFSRNDNSAISQVLMSLRVDYGLKCEIIRYVTNFASCPDCSFKDNLHKRFKILRQYLLEVSANDLDLVMELWNLVSTNMQAVEEFIIFLKGHGESRFDLLLNEQNSFIVFTKVLCSDRIDWALMDDQCLECFRRYFMLLEGWGNHFPENTELPPEVGMETVWQICLNISSKKGAQAGVELLLHAYETLALKDPLANSTMLEVVFSKLRSVGNDPSSKQLAMRCLMIISQAIHKFEHGNTIAHLSRGSMQRMCITVFYKRKSYQHNAQYMTENLRYEKGTEGSIKLEVHPFHSLRILKQKIIESLDLGSILIAFDHLDGASTESTKLYEIGVVEGSEIAVTYQTPYGHRAYDDDIYRFVDGNNADSYSQQLANDIDKFDCLLSLAQANDDSEVQSSVWNLIMSLPTQIELSHFVEATIRESKQLFWNSVLVESSLARTTYLLQILDHLLQPACELVELRSSQEGFRNCVLESGGLYACLKILINAPASENNFLSFTCCGVTLHIILCLLVPANIAQGPENVDLLSLLSPKESIQLLDTMLNFARLSALKGDSGLVENALFIIMQLIKSSNVVLHFTSSSQSKSFLTSVLKSTSKKVREIACNFAIQVGRLQSVVIDWLIDELDQIDSNDGTFSEAFHAISTLLSDLKEENTAVVKLIYIVCSKLNGFRQLIGQVSQEPTTLVGLLELLESLVLIDFEAVQTTVFGSDIVRILMSEFLFNVNVEQHGFCSSTAARHAAFKALSALSRRSKIAYEEILDTLSKLSKSAAKQMHSSWGLQISYDVRRLDMKFSGLKNQGCTCYMNSLLQLLYMNTKFRETVLKTPIQECHRNALWHRDGVDLVGRDVFFEWSNGSWRIAKIVGYDADSLFHRVQYSKSDGTAEEFAIFNIHEGRYQRETGRVKIASSVPSEPISEQDSAAYAVLEQLQRTFCFLKYSNKRYFDPRPFVDACKTLNLNFNVYHQNDASEFCDQLLDRIETATKGKHTKIDMWNDVFVKEIFGGKWLTQKIPKDCEAYGKDKTTCGQWQGSRQESFLKVELMIRGKDHIDDSLKELVQGELMDGENKIHCDVCEQKKATVRRTSFCSLPNTLILHLKRFDLDFQTFETVKLNNRMEFPLNINMLKYTKEGLELAEKLAEEGDSPTLEGGVDGKDYDYELQGVLVHAGVAQGGHYYSFVKDSSSAEWYRFDDDEVTAFGPDQIPLQCFGGSSSYSSGTYQSQNLDDDRTSNALVLFYNKVNCSRSSSHETTLPTKENVDEAHDLIDGTKAFEREVRESNLQHLQCMYLVDPELHNFVRSIVSSVGAHDLDGGLDSDDSLSLRVGKFATKFLLDVVLHCRERPAVRNSVMVLKECFDVYPLCASWFVGQITSVQTCSWFNDFLVSCSDPLARATFVQIVVNAITSTTGDSGSSSEHVLLIRLILESVFKAVNHVRVSDELFVLIRDLAGISSMLTIFRSKALVGFLCYFIMPDHVPPIIRSLFEKHIHPKHNVKQEYSILHQSVFEAIAALLGVPQVRKLNLLVEKSYWESELIPEAKEAFSQIFLECSNGSVMEQIDLTQYLEKAMAAVGHKPNINLVRTIIDRFGMDGKLSLDGFLRYHEDTASHNPKLVWRDLYAFGFKNDLSRKNVSAEFDLSSFVEEDDAASGRPKIKPLSKLSDNCRACLLKLEFYEVGIYASESSAKAILQAICLERPEESLCLIDQALVKLFPIVAENSWNNYPISAISDFLKLLLSFDDGQQTARFYHILTLDRVGLGKVMLNERVRPSPVHSNDYHPYSVLDRYKGIIQDLVTVPGVFESLRNIAGSSDEVKAMRGMLKLRPGCNLTEDDIENIEGTVIVVSGAGCVEVNGEYSFKSIKHNAGFYYKMGTFHGIPAYYTLYKCTMKQGGFQWFLSITPSNAEPGSAKDTDFYFANAKQSDILPPKQWRLMDSDYSQGPPPTIHYLGSHHQQHNSDEPEEQGDIDSDSGSDPIYGDIQNYVDESFTSSMYSDNE